MKRIDGLVAGLLSFVLVIVLIVLSIFSTPTAARAQTAESPTGRRPKILWTPERQAVWNKMVADYKANPANPATEGGRLFKDLKSWSDNKAIRGPYEGQWDVLLYQMTGEKIYADRAWSAISSKVTTQTVPFEMINYMSGDVFVSVISYEILKPALTPEQDTAFRNYLNAIATAIVNNKVLAAYDTGDPFKGWGARQGDSDLNVAFYFFLAMVDIATDKLGSGYLHGNYIDSRVTGAEPVGGLDATAADRATMRNEIREYFETSKGGAWLESSMYNLLTPQHFLIGAEAVRTATGKDHFPEMTEWMKTAGDQWINSLAPDYLTSGQSYQWGDVDNGVRYLWIQHNVTTAGIMAGYLKGTEAGERLQKLTRELYNYPGQAGRGKWPYPMFYYLYDPYAPESEFRNMTKFTSFSAPGLGLQYFHDSWKSDGSLFGSQMQQHTKVDHNPMNFGNFQLYRKNAWAVTSPIGWGQPDNFIGNDATNGMLIGGLSSLAEARGQIGQETATDGTYVYHAGTTAGQWASPAVGDPKFAGFYLPPPRAIHEWTRSLIYLPSKDEKSDTIVVFDRVHADNPFNLPRSDRYYPLLQAKMKQILASGGLKQWVIHTPIQPDTSNGIAWTVGSQKVKVTPLLPTDRKYNSINESEWFSNVGNVTVGLSERKFHTKISPTTDRPWDTFLNVVQAYDPGFQPDNTLVKSTNGYAEGLVVRRAGHNNVLALFNAKPGQKLSQELEERATYDPELFNKLNKQRYHSAGYTVNFSANTNTTDVILADLDPAITWEVKVDGTTQAVTVSKQGIGRTSISGNGDHTIQVIANGTAPVEPEPPASSPTPNPDNQPANPAPVKKAAIELTKSVNKTQALYGEALTYTITYKNNGTATATNVRIVDTIPTSATYINNSATPASVSQLTAAERKLTWQIGTVLAGQSGSVTYQIAVAPQSSDPSDPPATGKTLHVQPTGDDTHDCTQAKPCREIRRALALAVAGDTISVADGQYKGFSLKDFQATAEKPLTIVSPNRQAEVMPTNDRGVYEDRDTVVIASSRYVILDGLRTFNATRAGFRIDNSHNVTVRNSEAGNNGYWGIFTNHSNDLLLENNKTYGSKKEHGIYVSNSGDRPTVRGNVVYGNAGSGIQLNADLSAGGAPGVAADGVITGAVIEKNMISENGSVSGGGAINLDGVQDSIVRNNVLYDNHASGITNFKWNGAQGPKGMKIYHNTIVMASDARWALQFRSTAGKSTVRNNILLNRNAARGGIDYGSTTDVANADSDYNLMEKMTPDDWSTVLTLAQWQAKGYEAHSLSAPISQLFQDANAHNYQLTNAAKAKDKGQLVSEVNDDFIGKARPSGAGYDIGAYEITP